VAACRQQRTSLSLLLVGLGDPEEVVFHGGPAGLDRALAQVRAACRKLDHPGASCFAHGEAGFALILPDCDRRQAVQLGGELADRLRRLHERGQGHPAPGVSVGVATVCVPPRNFPAGDLLSGAERCLYASQASGGVVKSIEIY
jgi:GGDEF domain-containing protein